MSEPRSVIRLQKRPAVCLKCGRKFQSELNPEIFGEYGELVRGARQINRLCLGCRTGGMMHERPPRMRKGKKDAHATR